MSATSGPVLVSVTTPPATCPQRGPPQNAHRNAPRGPRCCLLQCPRTREKIGECRLRALIRGGGHRRSKAGAQGVKSQELGARSPSTGFFSERTLDFRRECDDGHVYLHFHHAGIALVGEDVILR